MRWHRICAVSLALLLLVGIGRTFSGPLTDSEVISRLGGVATEPQAVSCSTSSATAANSIPPNSLVRIVAEGGAVFWTFTTQAGTVGLTTGHYLPAGLVEYQSNGPANQYVACITRAAAATLHISLMN